MDSSKTLISIVGPTASGKTAAAIALANELKTAVVSADSRQLYRGMNIGTAKPNQEELQGVKHYLFDILNPDEECSAGKFRTLALTALQEIWQKNDFAILVGGSGLYIRALWEGMDDMPPVAEEIRTKLEQDLAEKGLTYLVDELKTADPETASKADMKNPRRVVRALEVFRSTGIPISSFRKGKKEIIPWRNIKIGLMPDKEILKARINERVDEMMQAGLLDEVLLLESKYGRECNALQTLGYREFFPFFDGSMSLEDAVERVKINSRDYAKRQLTWFKKDTEIEWMNTFSVEDFSIRMKDKLS